MQMDKNIYSLAFVAGFKRATDEGSLPEIAQYSPYYLPLNVFIAFKGSHLLVSVEWESRAIFLTIYDDLYKTYLWGICITLNLFVALTSASESIYDVINMASI